MAMGNNTGIEKEVMCIVGEFYRIKANFDKKKKEYEERRESFYQAMNKYFKNVAGRRNSINVVSGGNTLVVKKVESTSIVWDAEKLERRVSKDIASKVIKKQYSISDMNGLIAYLRLCGVNPNVFKRYINVEKTVDEKAVEQLGDTGYISVNQISGCYTVNVKEPYYIVKIKNGTGVG